MAAPHTTLSTFATRRRILARSVAALWLVLQIGIVTAIPIIDAQIGHADPIVAHWEDANDTSCPPQHDLSACQLCQQVTSAGGTPVAVASLAVAASSSATAPRDVRERAVRPVAMAVLSTRAPPVS